MTSCCEHCAGPLPIMHRRDARFCSGRCRVAAHRARGRVPAALSGRARWVRRSSKKVPLTAAGRAASSTDPATWCSYREARRSRVGAGLGFVVNGDGITCIDLDHCLDGDVVAPWAQEILNMLPPTWIEVSASGDGLHVWGMADFKGGRKLRADGKKIEIYGDMRYFAITAVTFGNAPKELADISEVIASLL